MHDQTKISFLFYMCTLFMCLNLLFVGTSHAQVGDEPVGISANYTFETIDVPGVEFLAVAASSDFEDYAGYTLSDDGEKEVAHLHSLMALLQSMISPARRAPISMRSAIMA